MDYEGSEQPTPRALGPLISFFALLAPTMAVGTITSIYQGVIGPGSLAPNVGV